MEISYALSFKMAAEKLSALKGKEIEEHCRKSGALFQTGAEGNKIVIDYLHQTYRINLPEVNISIQDDETPVELRDKILILHYLNQAKGTPLSNRIIAYQELQEGANYYPTFFKRAVTPLIENFGLAPQKLETVSSRLGGHRVDYGDIAVAIPAFPRVPITLVLWKGDEEFPPNANILFDSTIQDYLPLEDIIILCQTITWKLIKSGL